MDEGSIAQLNAAASFPQEASDNLSNLSQNAEGFLQGISDVKSIQQKQLNYISDISADVGNKGWFADMLGKLVSFNDERSARDEESQKLSEAMFNELADMNILNEEDASDKKKTKAKKGKVSDRAKIDDLKSLPYEFATLGAVLAAALNKDDKKKDKKGGGIGGFFKGLLEGVGGIAALGVALLAFAGAVLLFNFVDWGKAVIGLLAFTVFTVGMVALAKLLGKEKKDLAEFALTSAIMSMSLGIFGVSLYIVSAVVGAKAVVIAGKEIIPAFKVSNALIGIGLFLGFVVGLALISHLVSSKSKDFIDFAKASLLMSAALGVFAVSLYIVSAVITAGPLVIAGKQILPAFDIKAALIGLGLFGVFILGLAVVAKIAGNSSKDMIEFTKVSMLMSVSLVVFSVALWIASSIFNGGLTIGGIFGLPTINIKVDLEGAKNALLTFGAFILGLAVVARIAGQNMKDLTQFAVVSMLMSVSLVVFSVALAITSNIVAGNEADIMGFKVPKLDLKSAIIGLGLFGAFLAAFVILAAAGQSFMPQIAIFTGLSILMGVSLMTFAFAMAAAGLVIQGGSADLGPLGHFDLPQGLAKSSLLALAEMGAFMLAFIALGAMFLVPFAGQAMMLGLAAAAVALTSIALVTIQFAKAMALTGIVMQGGEAEFEGKKYKLKAYDPAATDQLFSLMEKFINMFADVADKIGIKGAIIVGILGKSVMPLIDAMYKMVDVVIKAADNKESIDAILNGDSNAIDHLMDPVLYMLLGKNLDGSGGLMQVANNMDKQGAKILQLVAASLLPLVEAMDKMIDVVLKAATLSAEGMTTEELVAIADYNLNLIMFGPDGTSGFLVMFVKTAEETKHTSKKAGEAMTAMPPMIDALSALIDVVAKAGEIDPSAVKKGVSSLNLVSQFLVTFIETVNDIIPGGIGGKLKSLFGGDPLKKLQEAHKLLQPGGDFYVIFEDLVNIAKQFDGKGFENLGKVAVVGSFTTEVLKGSENFKDVMKNIRKGVDELNGKGFSSGGLDRLASSIETLANVNLQGKFDPIMELASGAERLHSTANELERIANAMSKISKAEAIGSMANGITSVFKGLSSSSSSSSGQSATAAAIRPQKNVIEEIIKKWDEEGIKIKQKIEKEDEDKATTVNLLSVD